MTDIIHHLQNRVKELGDELVELERKRGAIEMKMDDVGRLLRATEAVLKAELEESGLANASSDEGEAIWGRTQSRLPSMSLKDAIHAVVLHKGQDGIHVNDILKELEDAGYPLRAKTPKTSIGGSIYYETKRHGTYEKVAPNTFKLAETQDVMVKGESVRIEND